VKELTLPGGLGFELNVNSAFLLDKAGIGEFGSLRDMGDR
jgi:hypothetical protein